MLINEATYKSMPPELRELFSKLPNPGSDEVVELFPETKGSKGSGLTQTTARSWKNKSTAGINRVGHDDSGSAARFFYCPKASSKERGEGNNHPTVKPIALMAYLCRLITPPGGTVLDPFMGSGSTGIASLQEGFNFIGIEREPEYLEIAKERIESSTVESTT